MKYILPLLISLCCFSSLSAQEQDPISWKASYKSLSAKEGEIIIEATIGKTWHTYSQRPTDAGPIPTSFTFAPSKSYEVIGATVESDAHEEYVPAFEAKIFVFKDKAEFRQKIRLTGKPGFAVNLKVEYMSCNDMMCRPPKIVPLTVKIQ